MENEAWIEKNTGKEKENDVAKTYTEALGERNGSPKVLVGRW